VLGWKYVEAAEESQKYKVGKFILETKRIKLGVSWENEDDEDESFPLPPGALNNAEVGEEEVEFDSQDEDECEDLFAGVWSPQLALKRRRGRRFGRSGGRITGLRARSEEML
jgi:hypothetical protein